MADTAFIDVEKLTKSYRRGTTETTVLRELDLKIENGTFSFIVGPSGSGKSTLLYLLGGLDQPTSGTISIAQQQLTAMRAHELDNLRRQQIGFIFQSFNLLRTLDCIDNVLAPFIPTGVAASKRQAAISLLKRVGLGGRMHHRPSELSGGEQQRVAIARAILKQPKLILADEPTGELDTETGQQVFEILREANQQTGTTVVIVTHDHRYFTEQDRVLKMLDGRFVDG